MKTQALTRFREKVAQDEPLFGMWVTLESPSIVEIAVALGLDWVVIDAEHGQFDWKDIARHISATVRSETVALVRIAERNTVLAKRSLDLGADGVVIPWVETAEQVADAVRDCRYPPQGRRGIGGERATVWGQCLREHTAEANEQVLVIPMIESVAGASAASQMCSVDGVDMFFFGPADHSSSAGYRGQWEGPGVADQILEAKDTIRAAGKHCGVMATDDDNLLTRRAQGFQMLGVGADTGLLFRSLHRSLRSVDRDRMPATSLDPADGQWVSDPRPLPPENVRPDRDEVVTSVGQGNTLELQEGVSFEALVGDFNGARKLTTGVVTLEPKAVLDRHAHPCSESITVLEGKAEIAVEDRVYKIQKYDNIVIPRWLPHVACNRDGRHRLRLHVALAMSPPDRQSVSVAFQQKRMPDDSLGYPGFERVTRFKSANRTLDVGTGVEFIDYFNAKLVPGIAMSGGFARFESGGRLPAHIHDFDESICIVDGAATCNVEGRRYAMNDYATAMVPRGRVHYFINESQSSMAMIWVYAGAMPERIVVDEACATIEGSPWK